MSSTDLYTLSQETLQALDPLYRPAMQQALADAGLEGRLWPMLLYALGVEPQPHRLGWLQGFNPYTAAEALRERLDEAAGQGFLAPGADG
jgi:hypothetical protein